MFVVRHGEVHNPERIRYGRLPGYALSAEGRAQIDRAARTLAAHTSDGARVIASPLERAVESAQIIASVIGASSVSTDPRLIEARSTFEGLRYRRDAWKHVRRWITATERDEPPGEIAARMRSALLDLSRDTRAPLVLVSHQLPIQYLRVAVEQPDAPLRPWTRRAPCETASITAFEVRESRVTRIQIE